jgi:acetyl esterase/lipase
MTFFDDNQVSRVTLELTNKEPVLRLMGDNGSAVVAIDYRGMPSFTLRGHGDEVIWSAP